MFLPLAALQKSEAKQMESHLGEWQQWWKWLALVAFTGGTLLGITLAFILRSHKHSTVLIDDRLLGIWQSDAERTVAEWRECRPLTDEQAEGLRQVFGHAQVTFTTSKQTVELKGQVLTDAPYTVVGQDDTSVVIRALNPDLGRVGLIQFHFVDADTFWVHDEATPLREYFRRISRCATLQRPPE